MPVPHLHILHPPKHRLPGFDEWFIEVAALLRDDAAWDGCQIRCTVYDDQAGFDVPTQSDFIQRSPGPVILVQNVRAACRDRLERIVERVVSVYCVPVGSPEDLYAACETARAAYEAGEPRILLREAVAYLIVRKLERHGFWGGTSLNKNFLWSADLPNGGFPKDIVDRRLVLDVAEQLVRLGVLLQKTSSGQRKYGLGDKAQIQPILDNKSFRGHPRHYDLRRYFERDASRVSVRVLDYND